MLLIAAFSRINIGIRHVLPVYLLFSLVAGAAVVRLLRDAGTRKWISAVLMVLAAWFGASSLISHPDYLAYFNEFAGSEPENIVVDSDLDWGQDVKRLAARLREVGAREVTFANMMLPEFQKELWPAAGGGTHGRDQSEPWLECREPDVSQGAAAGAFREISQRGPLAQPRPAAGAGG